MQSETDLTDAISAARGWWPTRRLGVRRLLERLGVSAREEQRGTLALGRPHAERPSPATYTPCYSPQNTWDRTSGIGARNLKVKFQPRLLMLSRECASSNDCGGAYDRVTKLSLGPNGNRLRHQLGA
jgi:hypothetical protein